MTARYTKFPKKNCPAVSSPCWIPQADRIINEQIIRGLPQCDTIEKYGCMLHTLRQAVYRNVEKQCMKSCKAESYNIITSDGTTNPWTTVRSVINTLKLFLNWFSYREAQLGQFMSWWITKASLNQCTWRLKCMTSMQLWHLSGDLLGCFLDFHVMNMARNWLTKYQVHDFYYCMDRIIDEIYQFLLSWKYCSMVEVFDTKVLLQKRCQCQEHWLLRRPILIVYFCSSKMGAVIL